MLYAFDKIVYNIFFICVVLLPDKCYIINSRRK